MSWRKHAVRFPIGEDPRRVSLYFPEAVFEEIRAEAVEKGLSMSEVVRRAWLDHREVRSCTASAASGTSSNGTSR